MRERKQAHRSVKDTASQRHRRVYYSALCGSILSTFKFYKKRDNLVGERNLY